MTTKPSVSGSEGPFWRANIRNFGRVKSADIQMAPLVLLVGKNNTGKSYIASLIWSLLNFEEAFLSPRDEGSLLPDWFTNLISEGYDTSRSQIEVTPEMFATWVHQILEDRLSQTVKRVLSHSLAEIGALDFSLAEKHATKCVIKRVPVGEDETYSARWSATTIEGVATVEFAIAKDLHFQVARQIFNTIATVFLSGRVGMSSTDRAVYVPAGRTGLMLAFDALTTSALESLGFDEAEVRTQLPLPMIRYLQALANGRKRHGLTGYEEIAAFLESNVLQGTIVHNTGKGLQSFSYKMEDEVELPLYAASSMVTELAPFLLILRNHSFGRGLVFEEPEAHLHLSAQRFMARAIVRLVNMGVPVVVTTHSDTFLQELNILMQVHQHEARDELIKKFGYEMEDLLNPTDVRGYEFVGDGARSSVRTAEIGDYGIVVPTLNDTLNDIAAQLQEVLD